MNITLDDFGLEWDHGDGVKHKADYDDLIKAYEQTRWIPVSERLPKEEGIYLVTFRSECKAYLVGYGTCRMSVRGKKIGYGWYDLHDAVYFDEKSIIAWMPLPEPWKGE